MRSSELRRLAMNESERIGFIVRDEQPASSYCVSLPEFHERPMSRRSAPQISGQLSLFQPTHCDMSFTYLRWRLSIWTSAESTARASQNGNSVGMRTNEGS